MITKGVEYSIDSADDPSLTIDDKRRINTNRAHLYRVPRPFVYSARKDGQTIHLLVRLRITPAIPLTWVGYEFLQQDEEVNAVVRGSDPVAAFRPAGGVPPYTLTLEGVGPAGSIVYNPATEQLEFPNGLTEGVPVTGIMVVVDAENNRSELPFRLINSSTAPQTTFARSLRSKLGWVDGYGNGSVVTINLEGANSFPVPALNRSGARLTVSEPFALSSDERLVTVDPAYLSGVKYREATLTAEKDGERVSLVVRVETGQPFAFRGGHGRVAKYVLNGVTDLASITVPRTNFFQGPVSYRLEVNDPFAANMQLSEHDDGNVITFSGFSDSTTVRYKASNGTDTIEIVYDLRTTATQTPDVPPEGGELRSGVSKEVNVLPVSRATVSRAGLRPAMRWVDPCVNSLNVEQIRYAIGTAQTRIQLPEAVSNTGEVRYELTPIGTTPGVQYEAVGHYAVLPSGPRNLRYILTAISGDQFITINLVVDVNPDLQSPSPDYIVDCDEEDIVTDVFAIPTADTGAGEFVHFAGVLTDRGVLSRMSGSVVHGYKNLVPGAGYGVNKEGKLCRVTRSGNRVLMRAVSRTAMLIV